MGFIYIYIFIYIFKYIYIYIYTDLSIYLSHQNQHRSNDIETSPLTDPGPLNGACPRRRWCCSASCCRPAMAVGSGTWRCNSSCPTSKAGGTRGRHGFGLGCEDGRSSGGFHGIMASWAGNHHVHVNDWKYRPENKKSINIKYLYSK